MALVGTGAEGRKLRSSLSLSLSLQPVSEREARDGGAECV